jgi:ATP-dependent Clp endopeptidase proteolytic subunit ClpP
MNRPWIINAKSSSEIEILLYEMIGQDWWTGEGTTAKQFADDLKAAGEGIRKIHLRVNSPGGSVFDGLAIYNTLLSHGAKITAAVDGLAASIASVIVMAASEISMGDNAMMMIHNPWSTVQGDSNEMRKQADVMDKVKSSMIPAYRRHTSKSVEEVGALMDEETWMTAQEAKDMGFAEIVTTPEGDDADVAANFDPSIFSRFRNVPQQVAARWGSRRPGANASRKMTAAGYCACACAACVKGDCNDCTMEGCSDSACKLADCPMQNASARAKKALARARAAAGAAGVCSCTCLLCNQGKCGECTNDTCADPACKADGCPMQKASAGAGAGPCSCPCLLCNQGKCGECSNDLCGDPHCKEKGCPNQKGTDAQLVIRLRGRLKAQTDRANTAETVLEQARLTLDAERKERAEGVAGDGKWMARINGGLDSAEKIFVDLGSSLTSRQQAIATGRAASKAVQAGLTEIGVVLIQEKGARASEMAALRRIGSDAEKATASFDKVQTELARHHAAGDRPQNDRLKALEETLSTVVEALTQEQTARASDAAAVQRIGSDIEKASEMFGTVHAELVRRQHPAMAEIAVERLKGLEEKLHLASASLTQEKTARATDGDWIAALSEETAAAIASLTQEIAQEKTARAAADSDRLAHAGDTVTKAIEAFTAVQAAVTEFVKISASTFASTTRTKRVDGENLTSECFLWVGDAEKTETWALPWRFSSEEKTESHLRDALARFDQEEKIPASEKPAVHARLVKLCKEHGITVNEKDARAMAAALLEAAGTDPFKGMDEKVGALREFVAWEKSWQAQEVTWLQNVTVLVLKVATAPAVELAAALEAVHTAVTARQETVAGSLDARMKPLEDKLAQLADVVTVGKVTLAANGEWLESKLAQLAAATAREKNAQAVSAEWLKATGSLLDKVAIALAAVQTEVTSHAGAAPSNLIDKASAALAAVQVKVASHAGTPSVDRLQSVEDTLTGFSAAVAEEKNVRTAEIAWPKRMGEEVEQSVAAFKGAHTELWRRQFSGEAAGERLQKLGAKLVAVVALIAEEKTARAGETAWTKTVSAEVEQLAGVFKDLRAELAHRQYPAEAAIARLEAMEDKLGSIATAVTQETTDRAADVEALAGMLTSVKEAGTALESANEELGRRARLATLE